MTTHSVERVLTGRPASDGGGVRLTRVISPEQGLDPFLLLDEFDSSHAGDYIAGFPAHPHRGFETVTYMLDGHMLHEDHLGNRGDLTAGAVQWMTAGRGIIHSEMPQQTAGRMRGFQLWINLPAADKMKPAGYQDLAPERIPTVALPGAQVRVVAGRFEPLAPHSAPVAGPVGGGATVPLYLDVGLDPGARLTLATPAGRLCVRRIADGRRPEPREGRARYPDARDDARARRGRPRGAGAGARRPAARRAGRALRAVRHEYGGGDRAGDPRLPERPAHRRGLTPRRAGRTADGLC
jgi:quercetin 2,3-dioxygenase